MARRANKRPDGRPGTAPLRSGAGDRLYGIHAVLAALGNPARQCRTLWATRNAALRFQQTIEAAGITPEIVEPPALERIAGVGAVHQGLVLDAAPLPEPAMDDLPLQGTIVILDQVTDPHNFGAILRVAAAFGVEAAVTTERHSPDVTPALAKAASGGLEHVPVVRVTNLARAITTLSERRVTVIGLDGAADAALESLPVPSPCALVLGAEGKGLRRLTRERCDQIARIDLPGPVTSLNVSTAAAIGLYIVSHGRR